MSLRALSHALCQGFCRAPVYRSRATPLAETLNRAAPEATPAFLLSAQLFPVALFRASLDSRKSLCGFLLTDEPQRCSWKREHVLRDVSSRLRMPLWLSVTHCQARFSPERLSIYQPPAQRSEMMFFYNSCYQFLSWILCVI